MCKKNIQMISTNPYSNNDEVEDTNSVAYYSNKLKYLLLIYLEQRILKTLIIIQN